MANQRNNSGLVSALYLLLLIAALGLTAYGIAQKQWPVVAGGAAAALGVVAAWPIAVALHARNAAAVKAMQAQDRVQELLASINDRMLVSDAAKRIAYREKDRDVLRKAIREDIHKGDYEAALVLVHEMGQTYGYREEAEEFRDQILLARASEMEKKVTQSLERLEQMLGRFEWERAAAEAAKLQRLFPDSPRTANLHKHVKDAREQRKRDLERQFLEASQRDDVERAMDLLKEMDKYLTEAEAEPFRETARGVIGKKRSNLGVQFKLSVQDKEWTSAVRVGEQIIREFPNSKMADEVRSMLDLLRARASGEQAAKAQQTV